MEGLDWCPIEGSTVRWMERERCFEMEEVKNAIFECSKEKAPGSDGFTMALMRVLGCDPRLFDESP